MRAKTNSSNCMTQRTKHTHTFEQRNNYYNKRKKNVSGLSTQMQNAVIYTSKRVPVSK